MRVSCRRAVAGVCSVDYSESVSELCNGVLWRHGCYGRDCSEVGPVADA